MINLRPVVQSLLPAHQPQMPWGRINSLIDGIFGFSATVLIFRLATPDYEEGELGAALLDQAPSYLLYGVAFLQIVGTWSTLRRLSSWTVGIDFYGMLFAFVSLMMWATLPFNIDILASALGNDEDVASIARLMALVLLGGLLAFTALWWRLERLDSFRDGLDRDVFRLTRLVVCTLWMWPVAVFALSYVNVWASLGVYAGAVLLSLIPIEAMTTEMYAEN